jgi:hypothetical protein
MAVLMTRIISEDGDTHDRVVEGSNQPTCVRKAVEAAEEERGVELAQFVLLAAPITGDGADFTAMMKAFDTQEERAREVFGCDEAPADDEEALNTRPPVAEEA